MHTAMYMKYKALTKGSHATEACILNGTARVCRK